MLGPIDTRNPVARHPLNVGTFAWWLPLPSNSGASTLIDIAGRNNGTLANGTRWSTTPYKFSAVAFDGVDDSIDFGGYQPAVTSVSWWMRRASAANHSVIAIGADSWDSSGWTLSCFEYLGTLYFRTVAGAFGQYSETAPTAGEWAHYTVIRNDTTGDPFKVYRNGRVVGSHATGGTGTGVLRVGGTSGGRFPGDVTDLRMASRAWSAAEVWQLYDQSARGHPDTLRRWSWQQWAAQAVAGGGFQSAWARGSNVVLQPGITA